ncbi:hypothetical protein BJ508DRAFT_328913 [Ascobolus immersus RN42]|uniref:Arrestin C-terminal-like domain-containing protein n=1 Tax=Ascobolus immersus RN42 TaxID=1160509 RepID=A0A3N4HY13_ASCIM|nr:hypothetical protein BJ508DRAFT_328913 [Ascobolus immersus RN42]
MMDVTAQPTLPSPIQTAATPSAVVDSVPSPAISSTASSPSTSSSSLPTQTQTETTQTTTPTRRLQPAGTVNPFSLVAPQDSSTVQQQRQRSNPTAAAKRFIASAVSRTRSASASSSTSSAKNTKRSNMTMSHRRNRNSICGPIGGGTSGIPSHANSVRNSTGAASSTTNASSSSSSLLRPPPTTRRRSNSWHGAAPPSRPASSHGSLTGSVGVGCGYPSLAGEKPLASTSGGSVSMTIALAEPVLFLQGFDHSDPNQRTPAMLRGSMVVRITKPTKIKTITLAFKGRARTEWQEGIPPKKNEFFEEEEIMNHTWPFFNYQFPMADLGHMAHCARIDKNGSHTSLSALGHLVHQQVPSSLGPVIASADRRLSLQSNHSRSFSKDESSTQSIAQKGYRIFLPGEYIYNFELPLESCLPETINVDLGSVKYELEGTIERAGTFRAKLTGKKEVTLIRCPAEGSLECSEPIAINRNWDDQLQYDIVISGKSFPLGSTIPIAFRLTPLAKVKCHRIKIYITENVEYFCKNKKVHRMDPVKKVQLFEKRADGQTTSAFKGSSVRIIAGGGYSATEANKPNPKPDSNDNLLGDLGGITNNGPTEMEVNVQLPGCHVKERDRIRFDTTYKNIQVHHWIKIVMRLSKQDANDPTKRRHFEISIDSPLQILSCKATHANTSLPAYDQAPGSQQIPSVLTCSCPLPPGKHSHSNPTNLKDNLAQRTAASAPPSPPQHHRPLHQNQANTFPVFPAAFHSHSHDAIAPAMRPIHLIRAPSHNPPAFDADVPPPDINLVPPPGFAESQLSFMTPPPKYETIVSDCAAPLADYFSRLADLDSGDDSDADEVRRRSAISGVSNDSGIGMVGMSSVNVSTGANGLLADGAGQRRQVRSMDERRTWGEWGEAR